MTPEAKKHCEELAENSIRREDFDIYDAELRILYFKAGFQAGYSYNEEKLKIAIETLEKYKTSAFEINGQVYKVGAKAEEALSKIKALRGEV